MMFRFVIFTVVLAAACALIIPEGTKSVATIVNGTVEYVTQNPEKLIDEDDECPQCLNITYKFGKRVDGDHLIKRSGMATDEDGGTIMRYPPPNKTGSIVTFVESFVRQTNNLSTCVITEGGIGQRHIVIDLSATNVTYFAHHTFFYGHD